MAKPSPVFFKIHPNIFENDKFRRISSQTFHDWVKLLAHAVKQESDGFISLNAALDIAREDSIDDLLERGLLDHAQFNKLMGVPEVVLTIEEKRKELDNKINTEKENRYLVVGFVIHDYTDHQTSKEQIEATRAENRKKSQRNRNRLKQISETASRESENDPINGVQGGVDE